MAGTEALPRAVERARGPAAFAAARNPYVGPRPLELGEQLWGRDEEVSALYFLLSAERIVLLHSPSGAGKSSLVQAGLIPRLREAFDVWRPTRVNQEPCVAGPAGRPLNRYVHSAILGFEEGIPPALRRPAAELAGLTLAEYAAGRPKRPGAPPGALLIFDQFEEVLTVDPLAMAARRELFDQLGALLRDPHIWALFVLREDYLAPLDPYAHRVPTHLKNRFRIDLLGLAAAREAIVSPAEEKRRAFPAADKLVHDLATMKVQQPDGSFVEETGHHVEPVQLQVVCRRLWDAMPENDPSIDEADLERFGSVDKALAGYYANAVDGIAAGDLGRERAIRDWVGERLITSGGIRSQVLRSTRESDGLANDLIEQLRATHLVRAEKRAGATWYELAHDRLIKPVREDNAVWCEEHLNTVQQRAALWESQGRPAGLLLAAEELADAEVWAAAHEAELTAMERRYLTASAEAAAVARQKARQARWIQRLSVAATVLAVTALVAGGFAWRQWWKAKEVACRAHDLAHGGVGASLLETKPLQAGLILLEVRGTEQAGPTAEALHRALAILEGKDTPMSAILEKHEDGVLSASFSPDGRRVVTASEDGTFHLWNAATGRQERELRNPRSGETFRSASFSSDGRWAVTASSDGTAQVWNVATGEKLGEPLGHEKAVRFASFSPDGRHVLTASGDAAWLWDRSTGAVVRELPAKGVASASFSPDGRKVVTASWDGTAQVWNAATGEKMGEPLRHREAVRFAAFSPDGKRVVTASHDGAARIWDVATGKLSGEPLRHTDGLRFASFSPNGRSVVTASDDETARLWEVDNGKESALLEGHTAAVRFASFSQDGHRLVTVSADGTARLWELQGRNLQGEALEFRNIKPRLARAAFSPDGTRIVTASRDTILFVDAFSSKTSAPLGWETCGSASALSFSADGRLVAACKGGTVRIRSVISGKEDVWRFPNLTEVLATSLSPDGSHLVTASRNQPTRLWDVRSKNPIVTFLGHRDKATAVSFSPDGQWIATASADRTVVWSAATRKARAILAGHGAEVAAVSFSHDGKRIVTASEDDARLWDALTGKSLGTLRGHEDKVTAASFSSDDRYILTASLDKTVRRWANPSDYTSFLLGRLRARNESCLMPAVRVDALGETAEDAERGTRVCRRCVPVFFARLGNAPESRPEIYVEAWRAYQKCREAR